VIKFQAVNEKGEQVMGIGLSRENCNRLLTGLPIILRPDALGIPWPGEIVIFAGETEESLTDDFMRAGMLDRARIHTFDPAKEGRR
jgi:hypothetical protein